MNAGLLTAGTGMLDFAEGKNKAIGLTLILVMAAYSAMPNLSGILPEKKTVDCTGLTAFYGSQIA